MLKVKCRKTVLLARIAPKMIIFFNLSRKENLLWSTYRCLQMGVSGTLYSLVRTFSHISLLTASNLTPNAPLPHFYLTPTAPLPHSYLTPTAPLPHSFFTCTSFVIHSYFTHTSMVPHWYLARTLLVYDRYLTCISLVREARFKRLAIAASNLKWIKLDCN